MTEERATAALLRLLRQFREREGLTPEQIDEKLILGPGWTRRFESGEIVPGIDMFLAMTRVLGVRAEQLFASTISEGSPLEIDRFISAEQHGRDLQVRFRYASYDAFYEMSNATLAGFEEVIKTLRNGLAQLAVPAASDQQAAKTAAVVSAFLHATHLWPHLNPSDLWWFVISRAYCDPFNHPAQFARLDLGQSWKRTAGWALEEVLVRHYAPFLRRFGVQVELAKGGRKRNLLSQLKLATRLEAAKVDVLLVGQAHGEDACFGVVHVKASFAERRTDDVPLSQALLKAGYASPLWTLDCKSTPGIKPVNKGELGRALGKGPDRRSAKRKDIEDDGLFSACFSYNSNTVPTPPSQLARARVYVCNFRSPDDDFSRFLIERWEGFKRRG